MKKLTPVLLVEDIESCLPFWLEKLKFQMILQVPQEDRLGFVSLQRGGVEIMLQSRASVAADVPAMAEGEFLTSGCGLFVEVEESLEHYLPDLQGVEVVFPRRQTFYGADEIGIRCPGGIVLVLAHMSEEAAASEAG
ncbi:MAG: hypothetical protein DWQ01_11450 [Planctomycetota bacterium]|nr:MAG: hypothetical protein DWQ01_11450 [Planctomycetota bacterium]